jgi:hypothetical protein
MRSRARKSEVMIVFVARDLRERYFTTEAQRHSLLRAKVKAVPLCLCGELSFWLSR